jgi:hypothetical protein
MKSTLVVMGINTLGAAGSLALFVANPTDWTALGFALVNIAFVVLFVLIYRSERQSQEGTE